MILYEIIIGNNLDNTNFSKLVLSNEPLCKKNINIYSIAGINKEYYNIINVVTPKIEINAWDASEFEELDRIRKIL